MPVDHPDDRRRPRRWKRPLDVTLVDAGIEYDEGLDRFGHRLLPPVPVARLASSVASVAVEGGVGGAPAWGRRTSQYLAKSAP